MIPRFVGSVQYQREQRRQWLVAHPEALKERNAGYRKAWYEILDGAHRVEAAHLRGLKRIPVFVGRRRRRAP